MTRRSIPLVLALLTWFSCAWFGSWELNPNNATRLFAAISLAEDGDAKIDAFASLTIDKAQFGAHFYLDKAPGMTLMAIPAVWLADAVTGERAGPLLKDAGDPRFVRFLRLRMRLAVATGIAVLTALAAAALFDLALGLTGSTGAALFAALGYALGTPLWGWSTTLLGHAAVAALFVIALWALWRERAVIAGLALGWAVTVEYQAVLAGAVLALLGLWHFRRRPALTGLAALGGIIGLLPLAGYNLLAFGTPFKVGYSGVQGFEGMHQGLFGLTAPSPRILWEVLFGTHRGLLWVAPVLVLAVPGLADMVAAQRTRAIGLAAVGAAAVALLVNAAYVYWDGGNSTGPRHAMPAVGLLALGLAPFWAGLRTVRARRLAAIVLGISVLLNLVIAGCDIFAAQWEPSQLTWVAREHLLKGDVTSVASDWWGWSKWSGFAVWAAVALPTIAWLMRAALRESGPRVRMLGSA